jgi:hypothetical protein
LSTAAAAAADTSYLCCPTGAQRHEQLDYSRSSSALIAASTPLQESCSHRSGISLLLRLGDILLQYLF